jgi:uncharacterized protein YjbI with pentapeptide repeats
MKQISQKAFENVLKQHQEYFAQNDPVKKLPDDYFFDLSITGVIIDKEGWKLWDRYFRNCEFKRCVFIGFDFYRSNLNKTNFSDCRFINCSFVKTEIHEFKFENILFLNCNIRKFSLYNGEIVNCSFLNCFNEYGFLLSDCTLERTLIYPHLNFEGDIDLSNNFKETGSIAGSVFVRNERGE